MDFWNPNIEINFFKEALKHFASPEQLFYKRETGYFAYIPKGETAENRSLQSRNSLIGKYTEKWCRDFLAPIAKSLNLFAVNGVICPEIGLSKSSSADLAFCTTRDICQKSENIKLIFEIKMSIVNNYLYQNGSLSLIGDLKTHKGNPSILRSDSMLKAIGKSINLRISDKSTHAIPILILGNSPITQNYFQKVDTLKQSGIIQGFLSLYPHPTESCLSETPKKGFRTFSDYRQLSLFLTEILSSDLSFFSALCSKKQLGSFIETASKEKSDEAKAETFLKLLQERQP